MEIENAKYGAVEWGLDDIFIRWPKTAKKAAKLKLASALEEATQAGAKFFLLPDRLTGFSSTFLFEREFILLLRDLLKEAGSCNTLPFFVCTDSLFPALIMYSFGLRVFTQVSMKEFTMA